MPPESFESGEISIRKLLEGVMSLHPSQLYEFADFRIDLAEKVLRRADKPVAVTPKAFQLLTILVENHGRIVAKEKLMSEMWADCVVEEGNLAFNVRVLRKTLGDDAQNPRFIETVPRRGYRFIAEVKEIESKESNEQPEIVEMNLPPTRFLSGRAYLLATLLLLAVSLSTVAGSWFLRKIYAGSSESAPILAARFASERFSASGSVFLAVISPNGEYAAYVDETGGRFGIWVRKLDTAEDIQIVPPSADYYWGLAFSHDGNSLYFVRRGQEDKITPAVYRVMTFGGVPVKILEKTEGWISISPDDKQISFVRCGYQEGDFCSLYTADVDGQNERKMLTRAHPLRIGDNQFSPDGKSIAFATGQSWNGSNDYQLMQVNLETGAESEITVQKFFHIKNLKWLPDGKNLLFTAKETLDGTTIIWRVTTLTGEVEKLTKDATDYNALSLDHKAERMIATQVSNNMRLQLSSISKPEESKTLTAARDITLAPSGKIIYSTEAGDLWTINSDGGEQRQLTNNPATDFFPQASPDERFIFFTSNRSGANQVWRMNFDGTNQIQITTKEGGYPLMVTPDGKWVYYESSLNQTLWKAPAEGGEAVQVSDRKVSYSVVSPDGTMAAYFFRDKDKILKIGVISLLDDEQIKILDYAAGKSPIVKIAWSNDNRTINFVTRVDSKNTLWQQSLDEDQPRFIADLGDEPIRDLVFAPDDNSFAVVRGRWIHDAVLIDGLK